MHFLVTETLTRSNYIMIRIVVLWDVILCGLVDVHFSEKLADCI
jgi:hypothetical protein